MTKRIKYFQGLSLKYEIFVNVRFEHAQPISRTVPQSKNRQRDATSPSQEKEGGRRKKDIIKNTLRTGDPQPRSAAVASLCSLQAKLRSIAINIILIDTHMSTLSMSIPSINPSMSSRHKRRERDDEK